MKLKKGTKQVLYIGLSISILSCVLFFVLKLNNVKISYSDIKDYVSILLNASAMIFAIVGLWVSSAYPTVKNAMVKTSSKVEFADFGIQTKRLETLIGVLITSALIILSLLVFQGAKMIIPGFEFYALNRDVFVYSGVSVLVGLGAFQVLAIVYVIIINVTFINDLYKIIHDDDLESQF